MALVACGDPNFAGKDGHVGRTKMGTSNSLGNVSSSGCVFFIIEGYKVRLGLDHGGFPWAWMIPKQVWLAAV